MPKISDEKLVAIQVRLFESDLQYLRALYGSQFGVNRALRTIVRSFISQTRANADEVINKTEGKSHV